MAPAYNIYLYFSVELCGESNNLLLDESKVGENNIYMLNWLPFNIIKAKLIYQWIAQATYSCQTDPGPREGARARLKERCLISPGPKFVFFVPWPLRYRQHSRSLLRSCVKQSYSYNHIVCSFVGHKNALHCLFIFCPYLEADRGAQKPTRKPEKPTQKARLKIWPFPVQSSTPAPQSLFSEATLGPRSILYPCYFLITILHISN